MDDEEIRPLFLERAQAIAESRIALQEERMEFDDEVPICGQLSDHPFSFGKKARRVIGVFPSGRVEERFTSEVQFGKNLFFSKLCFSLLMELVIEPPVIANPSVPFNPWPDVQFNEHLLQQIAVEQNRVLEFVKGKRRRFVPFVRLAVGAKNELHILVENRA